MYVFFDEAVADGRIAAVLRSASGHNTYAFTHNQFLSAWVGRHHESWRGGRILGALGMGVGAGSFAFADTWVLPLVGLVGAALFLSSLPFRHVPLKGVTDYLKRWRKAGEAMPGYIERPSLHEPPPAWKESDVLDYGVEAVLVVDDEHLVDFFVLNQAHADRRMLVLAHNGYPDYVVPLLTRYLAEQPELPVGFLHGTGMSMPEMRAVFSKRVGPVQNAIDLGWSWDEAHRFKRVRAAKFESGKDIPVDWIPAKRLLGAVGAGLQSGERVPALLGVADGERDMHFG
ncbi:MAG: hypothetical protein AAF411_15040 [Myxococcota bacterium]